MSPRFTSICHRGFKAGGVLVERDFRVSHEEANISKINQFQNPTKNSFFNFMYLQKKKYFR